MRRKSSNSPSARFSRSKSIMPSVFASRNTLMFRSSGVQFHRSGRGSPPFRYILHYRQSRTDRAACTVPEADVVVAFDDLGILVEAAVIVSALRQKSSMPLQTFWNASGTLFNSVRHYRGRCRSFRPGGSSIHTVRHQVGCRSLRHY